MESYRRKNISLFAVVRFAVFALGGLFACPRTRWLSILVAHDITGAKWPPLPLYKEFI